jgi:hypothetical protein
LSRRWVWAVPAISEMADRMLPMPMMTPRVAGSMPKSSFR